MKFTRDALKQLAAPDTGTISYEMTPELKEKWSKIAMETIEFVKARTEGPIEAYAIFEHILHGMEDAYGIRGGIVVEHEDDKN